MRIVKLVIFRVNEESILIGNTRKIGKRDTAVLDGTCMGWGLSNILKKYKRNKTDYVLYVRNLWFDPNRTITMLRVNFGVLCAANATQG
jgi:hypothetical protein